LELFGFDSLVNILGLKRYLTSFIPLLLNIYLQYCWMTCFSSMTGEQVAAPSSPRGDGEDAPVTFDRDRPGVFATAPFLFSNFSLLVFIHYLCFISLLIHQCSIMILNWERWWVFSSHACKTYLELSTIFGFLGNYLAWCFLLASLCPHLHFVLMWVIIGSVQICTSTLFLAFNW
jgi:hypothetical protein